MTCEYFSRVGGKAFCRVYGAFEATEDKVKECQSNPHDCYEKANQSLRNEMRKSKLEVIEPYISAKFFNRVVFKI